MQSTPSRWANDNLLDARWAPIDALTHKDEAQCLEALLPLATFDARTGALIRERASRLIQKMRGRRKKTFAIDALLHEYSLQDEEGIALMCLAEALLRIPDASTREKLIDDKLSGVNWQKRIGQSERLFINAATMGLMITGNIMKQRTYPAKTLSKALDGVLKRGGRSVIMKAMQILGKQFVLGRNIDEALSRATTREQRGYRHSFDMLGEAAITQADAKQYCQAYAHAIDAMGRAANKKGPIHAPGISIKLSALHPRYETAQQARVMAELYPRLLDLTCQAKDHDIAVTIDAEEAHRLRLSLMLFEKLAYEPALAGWQGLGLAVQSYQKRAPAVIDWLAELAEKSQRKIMVRLIKGAYWDYEIKDSQVGGYVGYPVFTRKCATDVSFLACAQKIIAAGDAFYPQFATHNAHSVAAVLTLMGERRDFEFQCLHGMGDALYDEIVGSDEGQVTCRIYAPVGEHEQLLPYLVRRLLENGANSSFVNRIHDETLSVADMVASPAQTLAALTTKAHPAIPLPRHIFGKQRLNSAGMDLSQPVLLHEVVTGVQALHNLPWVARPLLANAQVRTERTAQVSAATVSPSDLTRQIGQVEACSPADIEQALTEAQHAGVHYQQHSVDTRAKWLEATADILEQQTTQLMQYCVYEAGKTLPDALAEVREAVDFCRYYASEARAQFSEPVLCPGVTGERNVLRYHPRGVVVAISPWNFPLAIFLGQVGAALMAGNVVIAKPAAQTACIAAFVVDCLHQAGFPSGAVQLCPGDGARVGQALVSSPCVRAVLFTGSTQTARLINQALAHKPGPITPFIAETGGQNALFVDSSALLEQVVLDVVLSAFGSAGQRCSACRVVYVQADILPRFKTLLQGAMDELQVGQPDEITTDVGPVIDEQAKATLLAHITAMRAQACWSYQTPVADAVASVGHFVAPTVFEIDNLDSLTCEVFGPILHIISFRQGELPDCLRAVHATGFGLTMGIHSRIDSHIDWLSEHGCAGNIYVNRNMTGAVVGSQPFGGEGLSGTGPKAGGPNYLKRLCVERCVSTDTTATGGNASLLMLAAD